MTIEQINVAKIKPLPLVEQVELARLILNDFALEQDNQGRNEEDGQTLTTASVRLAAQGHLEERALARRPAPIGVQFPLTWNTSHS